MKLAIALALIFIFLFLSAIHIYWGFGGKWGLIAAIPSREDNKKVMSPKFTSCAVVATGLLAFAVFVMVKSNLLHVSLPAGLLRFGLPVMAGVFVLRAIGEFRYVGFFKKVKTTLFGRMDTTLFSPICLLIGALAIALDLME